MLSAMRALERHGFSREAGVVSSAAMMLMRRSGGEHDATAPEPEAIEGETVGQRLRRRRKEVGLAVEVLATRAGEAARGKAFVASAVRNIENGTNGLRPDAAAGYAQALGVSPAWLLYGDT